MTSEPRLALLESLCQRVPIISLDRSWAARNALGSHKQALQLHHSPLCLGIWSHAGLCGVVRKLNVLLSLPVPAFHYRLLEPIRYVSLPMTGLRSMPPACLSTGCSSCSCQVRCDGRRTQGSSAILLGDCQPAMLWPERCEHFTQNLLSPTK